MTETPTLADWVRPGAEVLIYTDSLRGYPRNVVRTRVGKVAGKSFTVEASQEPRFKLPGCSTMVGNDWHRSKRYVVPLDSAQARAELTLLVQRKQAHEARDAVEMWQRNRTRETRLAAIAALTAIENDEVAQ